MDKRISHLTEIFLADLARPWTVEEMARGVNVSVSHLNRLFKTEFGQSPMRYLQNLRLERAADLLRTSFLSVREIRACTGFTDKTVFTQSFRKRYGTTPANFRGGNGRAETPGNELFPVTEKKFDDF